MSKFRFYVSKTSYRTAKVNDNWCYSVAQIKNAFWDRDNIRNIVSFSALFTEHLRYFIPILVQFLLKCFVFISLNYPRTVKQLSNVTHRWIHWDIQSKQLYALIILVKILILQICINFTHFQKQIIFYIRTYAPPSKSYMSSNNGKSTKSL